MAVCQICGREKEKTFVRSSQLGPYSEAACQECLDNRAETKSGIKSLFLVCDNQVGELGPITYFENGEYRRAMNNLDEFRVTQDDIDAFNAQMDAQLWADMPELESGFDSNYMEKWEGDAK